MNWLSVARSGGDRCPAFNRGEGDQDNPFAPLAFQFDPAIAQLCNQLPALAAGFRWLCTAALIRVCRHGSLRIGSINGQVVSCLAFLSN